MAKKFTLNISDEQLTKLYESLSVGSPITIALQYAGISTTTYYYWVAIYSVALYCKEQQEMEKLEKSMTTGVSLQQVQDLVAISTQSLKKSAMGNYIEPTGESILQYKNSTKFRKFANQVYEIINKCNQIRSEVAMRHLQIIRKSTDKKNRIAASGSMWFLERTMPDFFGRAADKVVEQETTPGVIPSVTVEFIDPNTSESKDRLNEMEQRVIKELKGSGDA